MAYIGKYLFRVIASVVLYCVQCSLRCTPPDISNPGLSTARSRGGGAAAAGDGCYCVIVHSVSQRNICSQNNVTL